MRFTWKYTFNDLLSTKIGFRKMSLSTFVCRYTSKNTLNGTRITQEILSKEKNKLVNNIKSLNFLICS